MKWLALSLTCPWDTCILDLGKRVENRTWSTRYRGEILIHAAMGCRREHYDDCVAYVREELGRGKAERLPPFEKLQRGGIVGRARIVDCRSNDVTDALADPWAMVGQWGWLLADVQRVPFVACPGALGLWTVPHHILVQLGLEQPLTPADHVPRPQAVERPVQGSLFGGDR